MLVMSLTLIVMVAKELDNVIMMVYMEQDIKFLLENSVQTFAGAAVGFDCTESGIWKVCHIHVAKPSAPNHCAEVFRNPCYFVPTEALNNGAIFLDQVLHRTVIFVTIVTTTVTIKIIPQAVTPTRVLDCCSGRRASSTAPRYLDSIPEELEDSHPCPQETN